MQPKELARINELAKKAKAEGLTDEEKQEQQTLRAAYIAAYRSSLKQTLDQVYLVDEDGNKTKLNPKQ